MGHLSDKIIQLKSNEHFRLKLIEWHEQHSGQHFEYAWLEQYKWLQFHSGVVINVHVHVSFAFACLSFLYIELFVCYLFVYVFFFFLSFPTLILQFNIE